MGDFLFFCRLMTWKMNLEIKKKLLKIERGEVKLSALIFFNVYFFVMSFSCFNFGSNEVKNWGYFNDRNLGLLCFGIFLLKVSSWILEQSWEAEMLFIFFEIIGDSVISRKKFPLWDSRGWWITLKVYNSIEIKRVQFMYIFRNFLQKITFWNYHNLWEDSIYFNAPRNREFFYKVSEIEEVWHFFHQNSSSFSSLWSFTFNCFNEAIPCKLSLNDSFPPSVTFLQLKFLKQPFLLI